MILQVLFYYLVFSNGPYKPKRATGKAANDYDSRISRESVGKASAIACC